MKAWLWCLVMLLASACRTGADGGATLREDAFAAARFTYYLAAQVTVAPAGGALAVTYLRPAGDQLVKVVTRPVDENGAQVLLLGVLLRTAAAPSEIQLPSESQETVQVPLPGDVSPQIAVRPLTLDWASPVRGPTPRYVLLRNVRVATSLNEAMTTGRVTLDYLRPASAPRVAALVETVPEDDGPAVAVYGVVVAKHPSAVTLPSEARESIEQSFPIPFGALQGFRAIGPRRG